MQLTDISILIWTLEKKKGDGRHYRKIQFRVAHIISNSKPISNNRNGINFFYVFDINKPKINHFRELQIDLHNLSRS